VKLRYSVAETPVKITIQEKNNMLEHERVFLEDILHSSFVFSASERKSVRIVLICKIYLVSI
jgi:hypothetical protein